jgi:PTS system mannose-specific IID component
MSVTSLRFRDLAAVFLRSFFSETLWTGRRMQNMGWLMGIWPVLRRLLPDPAERAKVAREHASYFSTHPYMIDLALGVAAGLEERLQHDPQLKRTHIMAAKQAMSGPLAALGEGFFWAVARPIWVLIALLLAWGLGVFNLWAVPLVFLVGFNLLQMFVRAVGIAVGYGWTLDVPTILARFRFQRWLWFGSLAGVALAATVLWQLQGQVGPFPLFSVVAVSTLLVLRLRVPVEALLYLSAACGVFYAFVRKM